jgi:hypothetical protein
MKLKAAPIMIAFSALVLGVYSAKSEEWIKPQEEPVIEKSMPWTVFTQRVRACWNVGSLSTEASATSVLVKVSFASDGRPLPGSISFEGFKDGSEAAGRQAFEVARRAILRCARSGYELPVELKEGQSIELVFSPEGMRLR